MPDRAPEPIRCPDEIFAKFAERNEPDMFVGRQMAMDWLLAQSRRRGTRFVIPNPDGDGELIVAWEPKN